MTHENNRNVQDYEGIDAMQKYIWVRLPILYIGTNSLSFETELSGSLTILYEHILLLNV